MSECPIWIVTSLERWSTVLCCAKSKRISIIYVVGSSQLTLENHEWGPQDSFKVGTKMNLQACIGKPAPSNPMSIHPRTKSNYRKKEDPSRGQNLDSDSWMTYVEETLFEILIFKYVYFDTMTDVTLKKREQRIGMLHFQYWERDKWTNSQNELETDSTCDDWSHCLYRRSFTSVSWAIFVPDSSTRFIKTLPIWQESVSRNLSRLWAGRGETLERTFSDSRFKKVCKHQIFNPEESTRMMNWYHTKEMNSLFPVADGTAKLSGGDRRSRKTTLRRETLCKERRFQ